jgi:hypothetical protein
MAQRKGRDVYPLFLELRHLINESLTLIACRLALRRAEFLANEFCVFRRRHPRAAPGP